MRPTKMEKLPLYINGVIDGTKLAMDQWLECMIGEKEQRRIFPEQCFPTEAIKNSYLATIGMRAETEIARLLRRFLPHTGGYGFDRTRLRHLTDSPREQIQKKGLGIESELRLLRSIGGKIPAWEGITWVLDLLPDQPKLALQVMEAYIHAHCQHMPDNVWSGIEDAMAIVRARFIECDQPIEVLLSLEPFRFEEVIAVLYRDMGYLVKRARQSDDGGIDVIAKQTSPGHRIKLLIQCKREVANIGVKVVRELYGVLEDKKGPKAVVIATAEFTRRAKQLAGRNARIELIGKSDLIKLMNEHLGPTWPLRIDEIRLRNP